MLDVARIPFSRDAEVDWSNATIPAHRVDDACVFHLKASKRGAHLAESLDLPMHGESRKGAIGIAPGEWLVVAPFKAREAAAARLEAALALGAGWMVEIGDGLVILDLGPVGSLIAELTGMPAAALGAGRAARTRIAGIAATFVGRMDGGLHMIFDRRHDRHIRAWLDGAT